MADGDIASRGEAESLAGVPTEAIGRIALNIAVEAADAAGIAVDHPYRILFENVGFRAALSACSQAADLAENYERKGNPYFHTAGGNIATLIRSGQFEKAAG